MPGSPVTMCCPHLRGGLFPLPPPDLFPVVLGPLGGLDEPPLPPPPLPPLSSIVLIILTFPKFWSVIDFIGDLLLKCGPDSRVSADGAPEHFPICHVSKEVQGLLPTVDASHALALSRKHGIAYSPTDKSAGRALAERIGFVNVERKLTTERALPTFWHSCPPMAASVGSFLDIQVYQIEACIAHHTSTRYLTNLERNRPRSRPVGGPPRRTERPVDWAEVFELYRLAEVGDAERPTHPLHIDGAIAELRGV